MSIDHHSIPEWEWNKLSCNYYHLYLGIIIFVFVPCCSLWLLELPHMGGAGWVAGSMVDGRG